MTDAAGYLVSVVAKLDDQVTPGMLKIIESLERASKLALEFGASLRALALNGASLAKNLDKAVVASNKFGDAPGLAAASTRLDTMAAASADIARNLEAAKAAGVKIGGPSGGGVSSSGGGSSARYKSKAGVQAVQATSLAVLGGVYENARLDDTNVKAAATSQLPFDEWEHTMERLRAKEFEYAHKYAFATGGRIEPFGEAILNSSRLLRTMPGGKQEEMLDNAMPYAAIEAKLKDIPLPEALEAFIGLAHQAGAYSEKEAKPLFGAMVQASLTTHSSLDEIAKAASYALPALHAAGANSSDVMLMVATMQQAGIMNTKSGTWINAMAMNALPNTLGSGLFKNDNQNKALHELGLYKGNKSQFYRNGEFDLMKEVAILAEARKKMDAVKFNAALRLAFGMQGQRGAAIFSEQTTLDNLNALIALKDQEQDPGQVEGMIGRMSTVAKADQTIAEANMTLMNATATFTGPVNWLLDKMSGAASATADFTKENPGMGLAGIAGTALAGIVTGKLAWKGASAVITKIEGAIVNALSGELSLIMGELPAAITALGGRFAVMAAGAQVALAGAIGVGIGLAINWVFEEITGTTIGAAVYDAVHHKGIQIGGSTGNKELDDLYSRHRAEYARTHPGLPTVDSPRAQQGDNGTPGATRPPGPPVVNVTVQNHIDGKEVAGAMFSKTTVGTSDYNPFAIPTPPSAGNFGFPQ